MPNIMKGIACISVWLAFVASPAEATSFDCAKAQSYVEQNICSSTLLQRLDEDLNSEYVRTLDRVADQAKVRQSQREWLRRRNACTTAECLSVAMADRIRSLAQWGKEQPKDQVRTALAGDLPHQPGEVEALSSEFNINKGAALSPAHPGQSKSSNSSDMILAERVEPTEQSVTGNELQPFKITLVTMVGLLLICIWLHNRGSMTIYQDYTDALWTTLTPILSVGTFFLFRWLELSDEVAAWSALAVLALMSLQILIQTYRSNGVSPYFVLALYAKVVLFTLYFLLLALLLFGGNTKADRRRRRSWAVAATALFTFFTAWICRNRYFSHIDDYLAGRA